MRNRVVVLILCLLALCSMRTLSPAADWGNPPPKAGSDTVIMPQEQHSGQGGVILPEGQGGEMRTPPETSVSPQDTPQHAAQPEDTQTSTPPAATPDSPAAAGDKPQLWQMLPLSDVPTAPKAPKNGIPPVKPENGNAELVIPQNPEDISFMEGRWRCETGLFNDSTHEPIVMEFQFDKKGRGTGTVFEKNTRCRGKARASLAPKGMRIRLNPQICDNGSGYTADEIQCRNKNNIAHCNGKNQAGTWKAKFFRITR